MEYEKTQRITTLEHVTHCIEYLRQVSSLAMDFTRYKANNLFSLLCVAPI